jgi:hypothetical protein
VPDVEPVPDVDPVPELAPVPLELPDVPVPVDPDVAPPAREVRAVLPEPPVDPVSEAPAPPPVPLLSTGAAVDGELLCEPVDPASRALVNETTAAFRFASRSI